MSLDPNRSTPVANWPRPLAFVFSGGGAYGATQVGMIRALVQAGITPDMVVGTSVGALNGAMFAAEPILAVDRLTEVWTSMNAHGVFGGRSKFGAVLSAMRNGMMRNSPGLVSPAALQSLIESKLPAENIEQLHIKTAVVATDAQVGQPKLLTRGPIAPALLASAAIPGVFPPVKIDGCFYVDGGVSANVPIRQAVAFGAKSIVVLDANPATMPGTVAQSTVGSVLQASMIMLRNQRADAVDDLVGRHPILHLPQSTPASQSSFDFEDSAALIEAGYLKTREFLSRLPLLIETSPPGSDDAGPTGAGSNAAGAVSSNPSAGGGGQPNGATPPPGQPPHSAWPPPPDSSIKLQ
ncbi:MAG: patatin-like phospholipase family protein [Acidimicrobiales bacterium]